MTTKSIVLLWGWVLLMCLGTEVQAQDPVYLQLPDVSLPEIIKQGDGPISLLLIPCMSCRWNAWEEFMERNQDRYTMYAVTLPGFGGTSVPDLPMNTEGTPWRDHAVAGVIQLIDQEALRDLVVVGHSWGSMVGVQVAAKRPGAITQLVAVDGSIESTSWTPDNRPEQLAQAKEVVEVWGGKFQDAETWRKFNGGGLPPGETVTRKDALRALKIHGSFMATPKEVVLQYWRENPLVDLTADLHKLNIPILDMKALGGDDQEEKRKQHLKDLSSASVPHHVKTVFLYDTRHFIMSHRPGVFDRLLTEFIAGREVNDFTPGS